MTFHEERPKAFQKKVTRSREGMKFVSHPWKPTRGDRMEQRLGGPISNQCGDVLPGPAMIHLQTSCWSLAQSSRRMTPEQDHKSEENCNLTPAKEQQMPLIA